VLPAGRGANPICLKSAGYSAVAPSEIAFAGYAFDDIGRHRLLPPDWPSSAAATRHRSAGGYRRKNTWSGSKTDRHFDGVWRRRAAQVELIESPARCPRLGDKHAELVEHTKRGSATAEDQSLRLRGLLWHGQPPHLEGHRSKRGPVQIETPVPVHGPKYGAPDVWALARMLVPSPELYNKTTSVVQSPTEASLYDRTARPVLGR
jgi:hypothetical protein